MIYLCWDHYCAIYCSLWLPLLQLINYKFSTPAFPWVRYSTSHLQSKLQHLSALIYNWFKITIYCRMDIGNCCFKKYFCQQTLPQLYPFIDTQAHLKRCFDSKNTKLWANNEVLKVFSKSLTILYFYVKQIMINKPG